MSIDRLQQCIRDKKNPSMVSLDPVADRLPPQLIEQAVAGERGDVGGRWRWPMRTSPGAFSKPSRTLSRR